MTLVVAQTAGRIADDWWKWAVWIEGRDEELGTVESVTYLLHPSFAKPMQILRNRGEKFLLEEEGWGEFTIRARVRHVDGKEDEL